MNRPSDNPDAGHIDPEVTEVLPIVTDVTEVLPILTDDMVADGNVDDDAVADSVGTDTTDPADFRSDEDPAGDALVDPDGVVGDAKSDVGDSDAAVPPDSSHDAEDIDDDADDEEGDGDEDGDDLEDEDSEEELEDEDAPVGVVAGLRARWAAIAPDILPAVRRYLPYAAASAAVVTAVLAVLIATGQEEGAEDLAAAETSSAADVWDTDSAESYVWGTGESVATTAAPATTTAGADPFAMVPSDGQVPSFSPEPDPVWTPDTAAPINEFDPTTVTVAETPAPSTVTVEQETPGTTVTHTAPGGAPNVSLDGSLSVQLPEEVRIGGSAQDRETPDPVTTVSTVTVQAPPHTTVVTVAPEPSTTPTTTKRPTPSQCSEDQAHSTTTTPTKSSTITKTPTRTTTPAPTTTSQQCR